MLEASAATLLIALTLAALLIGGTVLVARAWEQLDPSMTGAEGVERAEARVDSWDGEEGWVILEGERWRARSDAAIEAGDRVDVVAKDGLTLEVTWARRRMLAGGRKLLR